MGIIDGHSHLFQTYAVSGSLKKGVEEIEGFDVSIFLDRLDEMEVDKVQTMPQEMTRIRGQWLGSNDLSADLQRCAPGRMVSFAAAEPLDSKDRFNKARFEEMERVIVEDGLRGLLLTPPYGHYFSNDKRVYPFYKKAVELDIPIYFHHSHMFGSPWKCPMKYARIWLLDDLTIDFTDLRFNVEHMGYPWTEELIAIMARADRVYTDIAMFIEPYGGVGRPFMLARNLAMAREYGVLDRVFYGSDYVGENIDEYMNLLKREVKYVQEELNRDMERIGYPPLTRGEIEGILSKNVLKLWRLR